MNDGQASETNRARVRRLLLSPLGFRRPKAVSEEDQARILDQVCDDLGYLSDEGLRRVEQMLRTKGQGSSKNWWPDLATFRAYAEYAEPRPIEELPALRRWFGSIEGPKAIAQGTVVETWQWFVRKKVPPVKPQDRQLVRERAAENARRLQLVEERGRAGRVVDPSEAEWASWYRAQHDRLAAMIADERGARAAAE